VYQPLLDDLAKLERGVDIGGKIIKERVATIVTGIILTQ
jgi:hypothetical protein